jgi:hypothetical protein
MSLSSGETSQVGQIERVSLYLRSENLAHLSWFILKTEIESNLRHVVF